MFTWICPQCGREVPPAYTECPDCAARAAQAANPPAPAAEPPAPPPPYPPAPPQAAPPAPQPAYQPQTAPQFYPPQQYPPQQYPPPYPPQQYPPQQYPPPPYPPQQYQPQQYPPQQYPPQQYPAQQYPTQQYPPPYPPPQQAYAPPAAPRTDTGPLFGSAPPEQPVYAPPPAPRADTGPLFGSAPSEQPVYAPPPAPRADSGPPIGSAPPEPSHEPGAPRAGGMLFGPATTAEAAERRGLPTWLMTVLFAAGFVLCVWGIYSIVGSSRGTQKPSTTVESPAAKHGGPTNVWQKYIEVSGVRFAENAKKEPMVKFVLTNHASEDAEGLAGNVTLWGRTQKSEEEAAGTFTFNTNVPANGTKDMEAPLTTKLKIYELPDWQYVSTDLQITAPGGGSSAAPAK